MQKGYWMVHVDVTDLALFNAYVAANDDVLKKYGARFLAKGGRFESVEGNNRSRSVMIEFPSYRTALDCWRSSEYQAVKALREGACEIDIVVVEGCEA